MNGWMGEILRVDLTSGKITRLPTKNYAGEYLGGRGIAARIYWETVKPETRAFDPENRLIFMTGPLVATGAQAATQLAVVGKSPMTFPEGYCYGSLGGFVGAELKKAGFDGIIFEGRASKPIYLWIHDGEAEIRDAASLMGQNGYRTGEMLQQAHGEKTRYIAIGVSGERLVRTANALASHDCTLSAGFGAVMGSKNLKAIAILGTGKVHVADPDRLRELNRYTIKISRRVRLSMPPSIAATGRAHLLEVIGKGGCYQCGFECIAGIYRYGGRIVKHAKCQSMEYYLPWKYGRDNEPLETFADAPTLANDHGLETWELESMLDWLHDCYRAGALTEEGTGLPLSKMGTREFLEKLLHAIAYREGFGDILAEGLARVRGNEKVPAKARALFRQSVAPIGMNDLFPPRIFHIMALLYPLEPRIHHINLHEYAWPYVAWSFNQLQPGSTPVTTRVVHDIARTFWGSEAAGDYSSYDGKALAAQILLNRTYTKEILGLCDFAWPIVYSFDTPTHLGDPNLIADIFTAVTGMHGAELDRYAERHYNLQRLILLREGRKVPQADYPPEFNFTQPLKAVPNFGTSLVPGPDDEVVDMAGGILDREKYLNMLKEYYRLRGWDEATGIPRPETLAALGLPKI